MTYRVVLLNTGPWLAILGGVLLLVWNFDTAGGGLSVVAVAVGAAFLTVALVVGLVDTIVHDFSVSGVEETALNAQNPPSQP